MIYSLDSARSCWPLSIQQSSYVSKSSRSWTGTRQHLARSLLRSIPFLDSKCSLELAEIPMRTAEVGNLYSSKFAYERTAWAKNVNFGTISVVIVTCNCWKALNYCDSDVNETSLRPATRSEASKPMKATKCASVAGLHKISRLLSTRNFPC